jgi:hypothetical protein
MYNDDEGAIMLTHSGLARGLALYDGIYTPYGPAFYAIKYPLFHWFHQGEITHDLNRLISVGLGMLIVVLFGTVTQRLCKSTLVTAAVMIVVGWDTARFMHFEPGHPQELIMALLALVFLAATAESRDLIKYSLLGALAATFITIKINAGVFVALPLAIAILYSSAATKASTALRLVLFAVALALPLAVMNHILFSSSTWASIFHDANQPHTAWIYLAVIVLMSAASCLLVMQRSSFEDPINNSQPWRPISIIIASAALIGALFCGFALFSGSSLSGLMSGFLIRPLDIVQNFTYGTPASIGYFLLAILAFAVATALPGRTSPSKSPQMRLIGSLHALIGLTYFALAFRVILFGDSSNSNPPLFLIAPWAWLLILPSPGDSKRLAKSFIAVTTVLFTLYVYPVSGSQMVCLHLVSALPAAMLLATGLQTLGSEFAWSTPQISRTRAGAMLAGYAAIAIALISCASFRESAREYLNRVPARHLHGSHQLRLLREHYAKFIALAENTAAHSDGYITSTNTLLGVARLASLHYWSQQPPPIYFYDNENWNQFLNEYEKKATLSALESIARPALVVSGYPLPWNDPVQQYFVDNYDRALVFDDFEIRLKRSQITDPMPTWILRNETKIADYDDQIPFIDGLLKNRLPCTLSLSFNATAPGVLLGLQKSVTRESQVILDGGWPLAYVCSDGNFCVPVPGQKFKARAIRSANRIDDQRWHQLCLQMEPDRITVWVDGQSCGEGPMPALDSMPQAQLGGGTWNGFPQTGNKAWESFHGQIKGAVLIPGIVSPEQAVQLSR